MHILTIFIEWPAKLLISFPIPPKCSILENVCKTMWKQGLEKEYMKTDHMHGEVCIVSWGGNASRKYGHPQLNSPHKRLHLSWKMKVCSLTYCVQFSLNTCKPPVKGTVQSDASHNNLAPIKPSDYSETSCDLSTNPEKSSGSKTTTIKLKGPYN